MSTPITKPDSGGQPRPAFADVRRIGPINAAASDRLAAAEQLCALATNDRRSGKHVHLVNAYTVALADKDPSLAHTLGGESINLPDGRPLTWVSRLRRDDAPLTQIRGKTLFLDVFDRGRAYQLRHYLLGSTEEVLQKLEVNLLSAYPGALIVGRYSPPFHPLSDHEIGQQDEDIRKSSAQIVWVGLGTPKQDFEVKRLADTLPVVAVAVGAAFDFTAGTSKEAPRILVPLGLEWVYRLLTEPRRLWRRYLFGNARFVRAVSRGTHS
jgi:N-acetylglucosaminyldiphosphoundecaprenol N-acetyl-beta-D-mannosaminyltransferase